MFYNFIFNIIVIVIIVLGMNGPSTQVLYIKWLKEHFKIKLLIQFN